MSTHNAYCSASSASVCTCDREDYIERLEAENKRLREALTETQILFLELRRTIDDGHWFADDLDRVGRIAKQALEG